MFFIIKTHNKLIKKIHEVTILSNDKKEDQYKVKGVPHRRRRVKTPTLLLAMLSLFVFEDVNVCSLREYL